MAEIKSFFDIANNINSSYEPLTREQVEEVGNAFMLNRAMSNNFDTVFFADEANGFTGTDLYAQYLFYYYSVPKKKRYGKWEKKAEQSDNLKLVMDVYQVSEKRALEYLSILTEDQIEQLVASRNTGGTETKTKKKK
ncbi:MAG TPA: DNA polymerase clamp loader subunit A [Methanosarcina sp.]|nr:DNA polymerase clamp loader subunit A [Methanosarcina sp.]